MSPPSNSGETKDIREASSTESPKESPKLQEIVLSDADLVAVIEAWPELPPAVKAGILAMVDAAKVPNDDSERQTRMRAH